MSWQEDVKDKLDSIDSKLDAALLKQERHDVDIDWLKGNIKIGVSLLVSALAGVAGLIVSKVMG